MAHKKGGKGGGAGPVPGGPTVVAGPGRSFATVPDMRYVVPLGPPVPSPSEVTMFDMGQSLAGKEFSSREELDRAMRKMTMRGPVPRSEPSDPVAKAQRLMYEAFEDDSFGEEGLTLAEEALALHPDCADAYLYRAMASEFEDVAEAVTLARKAVQAATRTLGEEWLDECRGELWGHLEARPLLRSHLFLARMLWDLGSRLNAILLLQEALDLDAKEDGLGLRYLLLAWYLDIGEEMYSNLLLDTYKNEKSAVWLYGDALHKYWMRGEDRTSLSRAKKALKANPHVAALMLGDEVPRPPELHSYVYGDETEAWFCAALLMEAWHREIDALEWLSEVREKMASPKKRSK